jgi:hypothetical protein
LVIQAKASFFGFFDDAPEEVVKPDTTRLVHSDNQYMMGEYDSPSMGEMNPYSFADCQAT